MTVLFDFSVCFWIVALTTCFAILPLIRWPLCGMRDSKPKPSNPTCIGVLDWPLRCPQASRTSAGFLRWRWCSRPPTASCIGPLSGTSPSPPGSLRLGKLAFTSLLLPSVLHRRKDAFTVPLPQFSFILLSLCCFDRLSEKILVFICSDLSPKISAIFISYHIGFHLYPPPPSIILDLLSNLLVVFLEGGRGASLVFSQLIHPDG